MRATVNSASTSIKAFAYVMALSCSTIANSALADSAVSDDGPFQTKADLINYWETNPSAKPVQIYLNGRQIYEQSGTGRGYSRQYFTCDSIDGLIRNICLDAFDGAAEVSYIVAFLPTDASIDLDDIPYRTGAPHTYNHVSITTCEGDIKYYKVTGYANGYIPYVSTCYP